MFKKKINIKDALVEKATRAASTLGCTVDEFVEKIISTESDKVLARSSERTPDAKEVEQIANKLKGLGYLE